MRYNSPAGENIRKTEKRKSALSGFLYTVDSAQPRRLNNTTEGVENPTQSWDNNAAVYYIERVT